MEKLIVFIVVCITAPIWMPVITLIAIVILLEALDVIELGE